MEILKQQISEAEFEKIMQKYEETHNMTTSKNESQSLSRLGISGRFKYSYEEFNKTVGSLDITSHYYAFEDFRKNADNRDDDNFLFYSINEPLRVVYLEKEDSAEDGFNLYVDRKDYGAILAGNLSEIYRENVIQGLDKIISTIERKNNKSEKLYELISQVFKDIKIVLLEDKDNNSNLLLNGKYLNKNTERIFSDLIKVEDRSIKLFLMYKGYIGNQLDSLSQIYKYLNDKYKKYDNDAYTYTKEEFSRVYKEKEYDTYLVELIEIRMVEKVCQLLKVLLQLCKHM